MIERWENADVEVSIGSQRRVLSAACVVKIDRMPTLVPAPGLPSPVLGIATIAGQVMPVVDLGAVLELACVVPTDACHIVVVAQDGSSLALVVDRVLRISVNPDDPDRALRIEISDLFARLARLRASLAHPPRVEPVATFQKSMPAGISDALRSSHGSALAVITGGHLHYISLESVAAVSDELHVIPVPDPSPALIGVAIHAGQPIAVVRLDHLLGKMQDAIPSAGALVILASNEGTCAVQVSEIIGFAAEIERERRVDLMPLLRPFLNRSGAKAASSMHFRQPRYLLVEIAGQFSAWPLAEVSRVQDQCAIVPVPTAWAGSFGLTNIEGSVLPVLDAAAILGLVTSEDHGGYVVLRNQITGSFVVPVQRLLRIVALPEGEARAVAENTVLSRVATLNERRVWILSAALLAQRAGWRRHAA